MISWLMQKLIDVTTGTDTDLSLVQVTGLCVVCIGIFAFGMWLAYLSKPRFIAKAIGQYKQFVFQKISRKGISAFAGENTSFYISALSNDANSIETDYLANDARTAFQVGSAILDLKGLTRVVVTHALDENLLKRYDCVLTLKNGSITEAGSFEELMEKKGYFYSLYTVSQ